jgi:hypothetical protein
VFGQRAFLFAKKILLSDCISINLLSIRHKREQDIATKKQWPNCFLKNIAGYFSILYADKSVLRFYQHFFYSGFVSAFVGA